MQRGERAALCPRPAPLAARALGEVGDRLRFGAVALMAVFLNEVGVKRRQARIADHFPAGLVAVAAVNRVGEEAFHYQVDERVEELAAVEVAELGLTRFERFKRIHALLRTELVEVLAVRLAGPRIGGSDAGGEILTRRERELIALLGFAFADRAVAVELGTAAPAAGELAVAEDHDAALGARG